MKTKVTMSLDCERNGLRGQFISIAAVVQHDGENPQQLVWAVEPKSIVDLNEWVHDNVLPHHPHPTNHSTVEMLVDFSKWWRRMNKEFEITVLGHMIAPVETDLFSELHSFGLIGEFEGPYRFFDINLLLEIVTGKHDSLDAYVQSKGLHFQSHNPLEDAKAVLFGYKYLLQDVDSSFSMI